MSLIYIENADRSLQYSEVNEDLFEGDLVTDGASGLMKTAAADGRFSGIVPHVAHSDQAREHEYDYDSVPGKFVSADGDKAPYGGGEDAARIYPSTPSDNGTDPAPNITPQSVVGIAGVSGYEGRVVEEGYTDAAGTEYSASGTGDFLPIGVAKLTQLDEGAITGFDEKVRVVVDKNL